MDENQIWAQIDRNSNTLQTFFKKNFNALKKEKKEKKLKTKENEIAIEVPEIQENIVEEEEEPKLGDDLENHQTSMQVEALSDNSKENATDGKIDYKDLENFLEEEENRDVKHDFLLFLMFFGFLLFEFFFLCNF